MPELLTQTFTTVLGYLLGYAILCALAGRQKPFYPNLPGREEQEK